MKLDSLLVLAEKAFSKLMRPVLRSFSHQSRVSQSFFASLVREINREHGIEIAIFLRSEQLHSFKWKEHPELRLVMAGDSDLDFTPEKLKSLKLPRNVYCFIQNLNAPESENIRLLPIGIEDPKWAKNGMPWNFVRKYQIRLKKNKTLVGPFKTTHPDRQILMDSTFNPKSVDVMSSRVASFAYARRASTYRYIACPRGAGIDTHRFWETLYRGSVPVVERSHWAETIKATGLPMVVVDSWNEINNLNHVVSGHLGSINLLSTLWWRLHISEIIRPLKSFNEKL